MSDSSWSSRNLTSETAKEDQVLYLSAVNWDQLLTTLIPSLDAEGLPKHFGHRSRHIIPSHYLPTSSIVLHLLLSSRSFSLITRFVTETIRCEKKSLKAFLRLLREKEAARMDMGNHRFLACMRSISSNGVSPIIRFAQYCWPSTLALTRGRQGWVTKRIQDDRRRKSVEIWIYGWTMVGCSLWRASADRVNGSHRFRHGCTEATCCNTTSEAGYFGPTSP